MGKKTESTPAGEVRTIQLNLNKFEQLGNARTILMDLVKDQMEGIDKQRKETKAAIKDVLSGMADVTLAVSTCNIIAPVVQGADDADRQRTSKRRNFLKSILIATFVDYDFDVEKGRYSQGIRAHLVGDKHVRQARETFKDVADLFTLIDVKLPKGVTVDAIEAQLRAGTKLVPVIDHGPAVELVKIDFGAISAKIADQTPVSTEEKELLTAESVS